jgi:hypothetical protein
MRSFVPLGPAGGKQVSHFIARIAAATMLVVAPLVASQSALAQFKQQGSKLVGTGAVGAAFEGFSVALSGDGNTAIVGGLSDNSAAGAAWVFIRRNGVWSQQHHKLVGTGAVGSACEGYSVALSRDGNTAIVSGGGDNSGVGAAWVFTRNSHGVWHQQGDKLVGTGAVGAAIQGGFVALSGDGNTAIISGNGDNSFAGAAWVFTRRNGVWHQQGQKLVGTGAVGAAEQGSSVALSADGNTAVVGADFDNSGAGAAWVFTRRNGTWSQLGHKLRGTGAAGAASQGRSVALSTDGNTAIVGGYADNSLVGAAWVFAAAPAIVRVNPASGPAAGNTIVTIRGRNFTGTTVVRFDGRRVTFTVEDAAKILAHTPRHAAGKIAVDVTTAVGNAEKVNAFTFK